VGSKDIKGLQHLVSPFLFENVLNLY